MNEDTYTAQFVQPIYVPSLQKFVTPSNEREAFWSPIIRYYANQYNANAEALIRIARCESGFNPEAKNKISSASGLFQYLDSTWAKKSAQYEIVGNKSDPYAQIVLTAKIASREGLNDWMASYSCWR